MAQLSDKFQSVGHPSVEMGSLDENDIEIEGESLVSPVGASRKSLALETGPGGSLADFSKAWTIKQLGNRLLNSVHIVIFQSKLNILLLSGPVAVLVHGLTQNAGWVFLFSLLGIIPLAERLGYATEQLAFFTGSTVGGLLNATFGNATEMIISIYALEHGMVRVVQQSLLGSILSNMLLVLGAAFFSGGICHYRKDQVFNKATAVVNSGLLLMAVMGLLFPAVLHSTHTELQYGKSEMALSRFSSCIMLVAYVCYLIFQLRSHQNLYTPLDELFVTIQSQEGQSEVESEEEDVPEITPSVALIWLGILTLWVSFLSGYLVDAIEGASESLGMPISFISVILLPIVGNAAEHVSAIMFAIKDKLDISLGVAIGSSTQISMFVPMDLNFQLFETATLFMTVLVVAFMLQDGTSNYFKGLMLLLCYLIVSASFFFMWILLLVPSFMECQQAGHPLKQRVLRQASRKLETNEVT